MLDKNMKSWPTITKDDKHVVAQVFDYGILTGDYAPEVRLLERKWAEYTETPYCLAFSSGTAAIHAALYAHGVGANNTVFLPALTFSGSYHPILALGAIPVFVDIIRATFNIDTVEVRRKLQSVSGALTPGAIMPVHLHGLPVDLSGIEGLDVPIIEDACQAHGAPVGSKHTACYSLNSTKHLPAGEGGLLTTHDEDVYEKARCFRTFGEPLPNLGRAALRSYRVFQPGLNYRMPEMTAALARSQLTRLPETIARVRRNAKFLTGFLLDELHGYLYPPCCPESHVYHKYRVIIGDNLPLSPEGLVLALRQRGLPATLWHEEPLTDSPIFFNYHKPPPDFPNTRWLLDHSIILFDECYALCAQDMSTVETYARQLKEAIHGIVNIASDLREHAEGVVS